MTPKYKECLFLQVFCLTHAYGVENYGTQTELCLFIGFAEICPLWLRYEFGIELVGLLEVGTILMLCRRLFGTL